MDLGIHSLGLFVISGLLLNITPGPDSILIMMRSATQGWRAGSAAALGIGSGTMIHVVAAALGLSALLSHSALAFNFIKYLGAAYLFYLGLSMLWQNWRQPAKLASGATGSQPTDYAQVANLSLGRIYLQGFWTNLLNPKVALFFLAFVPQFIQADSQHKALAFIVLGCIFNFNGMLWCHFLAWISARASQQFQLAAIWSKLLQSGIAIGFIALSIKLALTEQRSH